MLGGGALASTVSHDAHNIIVVGMDDEDMARAVGRLGELGGGIVVVDGGTDDTAGMVLHSELEAWVRAGIPASAVLSMAISSASPSPTSCTGCR